MTAVSLQGQDAPIQEHSQPPGLSVVAHHPTFHDSIYVEVLE